MVKKRKTEQTCKVVKTLFFDFGVYLSQLSNLIATSFYPKKHQYEYDIGYGSTTILEN